LTGFRALCYFDFTPAGGARRHGPRPRPRFDFAPEHVITGFNTDVPYDGVTYHVQTEDKGLETPLILSLVYVGGAIIASKRTYYEDLISKGFDEGVLTERLQRQHKLIIAAIKNGRIEDLKRMGGPNGGAAAPEAEAQPAPAGKKPAGQRKKKSEPAAEAPAAETSAADSPPAPPAVKAERPPVEAAAPPPVEPKAAQPKVAEPKAAAPKVAEPARTAAPKSPAKAEPEIVILATLADEISALENFPPRPASKPPASPAAPPKEAVMVPPPPRATVPPPIAVVLPVEIIEPPQAHSNELYLTLLDDEGEFRAGQLATVKVYVGRGAYGQKPEVEASVTVKVLGTSFRPLILTTDTDAQGVGVVRALLPRFTSGRAAIIIRAVAGEDSAEMRRIIHQ
jgi:hypothetical protein